MSSLAGALRERMRAFSDGMLSRKRKKAPLTRDVIKHNRWDQRVWNGINANEAIADGISDLFTGSLRDNRPGYLNAYELVKALALALYKVEPRFHDKRHVHKDARLNLRILQEVMESPEYERLHDQTMTDPLMTTMALQALFDPLRDILAREPDVVDDANQRREEQEQGDGDEDGDGGQGQQGEQGDPGDQEGGDDGDGEPEGGDAGESEGDGEGEGEEGEDDSLVTDVEQAWDEAIAENLEREDDAKLDAAIDEIDIERMIHKAMQEAADELEDVTEARRGIGLEDGIWATMSPDERLRITEALQTQSMRDLAAIVGRMKRFAMGVQATKLVDVPHEAYDVEAGNDIKRVLHSEFALLSNEVTRYEFYRRYTEREMLQFKMRGTENAGKGPIIICIDKSGSMNGQPFNWAMAVGEALRRICAEQDRDYYAMFFGNNNDRHRFSFPKGETDFTKVMEFLTCAANGGTQFDGVLTEAIERVRADFDQGLERADIVFVTDGQASLSEDWLKRFNDEKAEIGCRVFGVYIGGARDTSYGASAGARMLEEFSDHVIPVEALTVDSVRDIFAAV